MKYQILGFQQQKLLDSGLSLEDALLLRTIKDMYSSDRMESIIQDEQRYIWINQPYLLDQIPILGSMSKLKRMLTKLCEDGFLDNILITNKKGVAGRFYYVKYTKKLDDLEDYDTKVQNDIRLDEKEGTKVQNDTRPKFKMTLNQSSKWTNKDTSIKDTSIKDIYIVQSEELWKMYPDKTGKGKAMNKIPDLIKKYGFEQMQKTIERYMAHVQNKRQTGFANLQYQNGSTFFNSGYVDYLDKNYIEIIKPKTIAQNNSFDFGGL